MSLSGWGVSPGAASGGEGTEPGRGHGSLLGPSPFGVVVRRRLWDRKKRSQPAWGSASPGDRPVAGEVEAPSHERSGEPLSVGTGLVRVCRRPFRRGRPNLRRPRSRPARFPRRRDPPPLEALPKTRSAPSRRPGVRASRNRPRLPLRSCTWGNASGSRVDHR